MMIMIKAFDVCLNILLQRIVNMCIVFISTLVFSIKLILSTNKQTKACVFKYYHLLVYVSVRAVCVQMLGFAKKGRFGEVRPFFLRPTSNVCLRIIWFKG